MKSCILVLQKLPANFEEGQVQLQNRGVLKIIKGEIKGSLKSFGINKNIFRPMPSIYDDWFLDLNTSALIYYQIILKTVTKIEQAIFYDNLCTDNSLFAHVDGTIRQFF